MTTIESLHAREIYDSRGVPTVEVDLRTSTAVFRASVPNGIDAGKYEARDLRDGDKRRARGRGCQKAVRNVNETIAKKLIGKDVRNQTEIDRIMFEELDGHFGQFGYTKKYMGANAILAVSTAVCRAGAAANTMTLYEYIAKLAGQPYNNFMLPVPALTVLCGGKLAGNRLPCREFTIIPEGASSFGEAMQIGAEVFHGLEEIIKAKYGLAARPCNVSETGGFASPIKSDKDALDMISRAINEAGYNGKVKIGIDASASDFVTETGQKFSAARAYNVDFKTGAGRPRTAEKMALYYMDFLAAYPIVSIQDPFEHDDLEAFQSFNSQVGSQIQIVGDQLTASNAQRIEMVLRNKACNCVLLVPGQIGSITECIEAATVAQQNGLSIAVSHRAGETEDPFIADLAVGLRAGSFISGAPCRSERLAKYNQLMRIETELGPLATYVGANFRNANAPVASNMMQTRPREQEYKDIRSANKPTTTTASQPLGQAAKSSAQLAAKYAGATKGTYLQSGYNAQKQQQYWSPSKPKR